MLEKIVLGTAISDPNTMDEISQRLRSSDFTGTNREIYKVVLSLYQDEALSYRAVVEALREQNMLEFIGDANLSGEAYIRDLVEHADSRGIKSYVKRIEERTARADLREVAALIAAMAADEGKNIQDVMDQAERKIFDLRRRAKSSEGVSMSELLDSYLPFLDGMRSGKIRPAWIPPIEALTDIIGYVHRTEFIIVAGRPGDGKSSLLRYQALQTAMGHDGLPPQKVLTFNLENDEWEYIKFALCTLTGINSAKLKEPVPANLSDEEYQRILDAAEVLRELPWKIVTLSHPPAVEVDRIVRKQVAEGTELVQVDYLQLMSNGLRNRVEDLAETTSTLRGTALQTCVPVVAACQLSRAIEGRGELAEPRLSDLRESGSIEQDATQVWFIRSMWHTPPTGDEVTQPEFRFPENFYGPGNLRVKDVIQAVPIKIYVKKNRNGPVGTTKPIKWNMATGQFSSFVSRRVIPF